MNILIKLSSLVGLIIAPLIAIQNIPPASMLQTPEKKIEVKQQPAKPVAQVINYTEHLKGN